MRGVPSWGLLSATACPVLLVVGWMIAGALQPGYSPVSQTVSVLAAQGASHRWVMSTVILAVGTCYVMTGVALHPLSPLGRLVLLAGAIGGMMVVTSPEPAGGGGSPLHEFWATIGFAGLAAWPLVSMRSGRFAPWALRHGVAVSATCVVVGLLAWFVAELMFSGGQAGLAERVVGAAQATWPLLVVLSCRRHERTVGAALQGTSDGSETEWASEQAT